MWQQSQRCATVTMGPSCLVFEIWPRDGKWVDDGRTEVGKHLALKAVQQ